MENIILPKISVINYDLLTPTFKNIIDTYISTTPNRILIIEDPKYFDVVSDTKSLLFDISLVRDNMISIHSKYGNIFMNNYLYNSHTNNSTEIKKSKSKLLTSFPLEYIFKQTDSNVRNLILFIDEVYKNKPLESIDNITIRLEKSTVFNIMDYYSNDYNVIYFGNANNVKDKFNINEVLSCCSNEHLSEDTRKYNTILNTDSKLNYCIYRDNNEIKNKEEQQYLNLLEECIKNGRIEQTRNGITYSLFGKSFEFDISSRIPVLTTKRVFWRGVVEELLFFLRGETNSKILEEKGINIWKNDTSSENLKKLKLPYEEGEMGPMYGYQWRFYGRKFDNQELKQDELKSEIKLDDSTYDKSIEVDQLEHCINEIINNPTSRRIIMTTFNPIDVKKSVLYPCHGIVSQFYVRPSLDLNTMEETKFVDLIMYQR